MIDTSGPNDDTLESHVWQCDYLGILGPFLSDCQDLSGLFERIEIPTHERSVGVFPWQTQSEFETAAVFEKSKHTERFHMWKH